MASVVVHAEHRFARATPTQNPESVQALTLKEASVRGLVPFLETEKVVGREAPGIEPVPRPTPRPAAPLCRFGSHRGLDWLNDAGNMICGVCHPPANKVTAKVAR